MAEELALLIGGNGGSTTEGAGSTQKSAAELSAMANEMQSLVDQFKVRDTNGYTGRGSRIRLTNRNQSTSYVPNVRSGTSPREADPGPLDRLSF